MVTPFVAKILTKVTNNTFTQIDIIYTSDVLVMLFNEVSATIFVLLLVIMFLFVLDVVHGVV